MSLSCQKAREAVSLYIDDMLSESDAAAFRSHLKECEACRQEYEMLLNIQKTLTELPQLEVSDRFRAELHEKLVVEAKRTSALPTVKRPLWRIASGAATAAAVIAVSVIALNSVPKQADLTPKTMTPEPTQQVTTETTEEADSPAERTAQPTEQLIEQNVEKHEAKEAQPAAKKTAEPQPTPLADPTPLSPHKAEQGETAPQQSYSREVQPAQPMTDEAAVENIPSEESAIQSFALDAQDTAANQPAVTSSSGGVRGGGGGSASASSGGASRKTASKQIAWHYTFTAEGSVAARALLEAYQQTDAAYMVPISESEQLLEELATLSGYCERRQEAIAPTETETYVLIWLHEA